MVVPEQHHDGAQLDGLPADSFEIVEQIFPLRVNNGRARYLPMTVD